MNDAQLVLWFKDKVLGDTLDPTDYSDQTVNIDVGKLLSTADFDKFSRLVAEEMTGVMYDTYGHHAFISQSSAYKFYGLLLSVSNVDKLKYMHSVLGD